MGLLARHIDRLPHHFHIAAIAATSARVPTTGGWLPILLVSVAIFGLGMWWVSTRA
jgi:hypothetical protein